MALGEDLKEEIQKGYRSFLANSELSPRLGQKQMIAAIANALGDIQEDDQSHRVSENGLCVVEAGTGTGKTLAYLLASLPIARQLGKRVVVATGTVALQEQLVQRDIPALMSSTGWQYSISLAKGRSRYLCPLRLEQCLDVATVKDSGSFLFEDEISFNPSSHVIASYRAMDESLKDKSWPGDRDSWPESIGDSDWQPLTVDRRQCGGRRCRFIRECCFFNARDELDDADCIVANHDLVMADLALGGGVILPPPEETIYVFDEGHRITSTALNHFSGNCRLRSAVSWLGRLKKQVAGSLPLLKDTPDLMTRMEKMSAVANDAEKLIGLSYPLFEKLLEQGDQEIDERRWCFPGGDPGDEARELSGHIAETLGTLETMLEILSDRIGDAMDEPHFPIPRVDLEQLFQHVGIWQGRVAGALNLWKNYAVVEQGGGPPHARWLSLVQNAGGHVDIQLSVSPTDAGRIFKNTLWERCYGAVVTSATIQALGNFDIFKTRSGLPDYTQFSSVAGAFDFSQVGVLSVPDIGADASEARAHTDELIERLPELIDWGEGTLVLFASRRQMELVYEQLPPEYEAKILLQGQWSNQEIVRRHKLAVDEGEGSVIFGLASFAEGMDFPGDYCTHVVIAKIPFSVPDDPVHATLSEWVEENGGNAFMTLMLPDASLRLHQACGRLIRTETDTGRITILDRRMVTKYYGKQLLNDLPPFRVIAE